MTETVNLDSDCNCSHYGPNNGGKGTTIWTSDNVTLAPYNGSYSWTFTDTMPKCYDSRPDDGGTQLCLITYEIATTDQYSGSIAILRLLNNNDIGATVHSAIAGHNVTEAFDIAITGHYNSGGQNTVTFFNTSAIPVQINNFRVFRAYAIWGLSDESSCNDPTDVTPNGNLDNSRQDYPCNYDVYGDRMSYVHYGANTNISTVTPGSTASWQFQCSPEPSGHPDYVAPYACFFNFNNVTRSLDLNVDLHYVIKLNGHSIADYYHGGALLSPSQFPTVDLVKSPYYNDAPDAWNTVELYNAGSVNLNLDTGDLGGVDVYRFYKSKNLCQDNFSDTNESQDRLWNSFTIGNASVNQNNGQLGLSISTSGNWYQAGYVTRHSYDTQAVYPGSNQQGFEAAIDIVNTPTVREMCLLISDTHTTTQDPYSLSNLYRFMKDTTDTTVKAQRRLGGTEWGVWKWWNSSSGQLKIKVSRGSIAFYENGVLRHAEPYMLPSSNVYLYAYACSNFSGSGIFDNFSIKPAEGVINDNFADGNYNGWTVDSGSWSVSSGKLQSSQNGSHIHYNQAISSPNRHVAADIQTLSGTGTANVAFLMVNEVNGSNMIYADIRRDGTVELIIFYSGTPTAYTHSSNLNPSVNHRIAVTITGNNAKVYVDNTLYINENNDNFANISNGHVGFYTYNSTGSLDNLVVFTQ